MRNWIVKGALKGHLLVQKANEKDWTQLNERFAAEFRIMNPSARTR
jgi:hypothetical protein